MFVVNQQLTTGQRRTLLGENRDIDHLYHLERIRSLLDSPLGYGLRLEYLRRPMTAEEQVAFVNARKRDAVLRMMIDKAPNDLVAAEARSAVAQLNVWNLRLLHRTLMEASGLRHRIGGQV
ncbi:hypothetical protein [Hamadaea tsunoensis]|uniref:hypothetical protein n=1 Tax=Hamadaea tsunoensis TaxID=53368 RepID=UPI00047F3C6E|nr:hypothetical protein [Hamadaea tsunoensis]